MNQQDWPGYAAEVPQVVATYAAWLRTKTGAEPEVSVSGSQSAQISVSRFDRTMVLTFACRNREWSLHGAEVRSGDDVIAFSRRELPKAIAALLAPFRQPDRPAGAGKDGRR